ncbi:Putative peptidyl-prolyl cis-trans isomerase [Planctomycetes bacterium Poly30]|uniref:peptidylprolyl isomerase n=1 Tax=Saltatorellus ferox TaxID=2528018 RepID=A0A518F0Q8_9BACT|nr:Putative peptidyl-prolyl cis-trans isomerase [Planctomycetes bacterium Poly30]
MLLPLISSRLALSAAAILGSFTLGACADSEAHPGQPSDTESAQPSAPVDPQANRFAPGGPISDAELAKYYIAMACEIDGQDVGTMTFDMWTEGAPITTRNFLRLADEGFYDGLTFHRILRDFMVQGGDPQGTGMGGSPHGKIQAEFSEEPERQHGYGVLSMARGGNDVNSASSQFFLCCDESQSVWGLDGKYASFGKLTSGVETLEKLANISVTRSATGENSRPTQSAKITTAKVIEGVAPTGETVERPEPEVDLGGEPRRVRIQQVLVGFKDMTRGVKATRTEEEARALAAKLKADVEGGADMSVLVREYSELPAQEEDEVPGDYRVLNRGVRDRAGERQQFDLLRKFQKRAEQIQADMSSAKIKRDEYQTAMKALQEEFNAAQVSLGAALTVPRAKLDSTLANAAFTMKVGEVIVLDHDAKKGSMGYRVVKRLE